MGDYMFNTRKEKERGPKTVNNKDIYIEKSGSSMFQQQVGWQGFRKVIFMSELKYLCVL